MAEPAKTRMSYAPPQKPAEPITKTSRTAGLQQQLFRTLRQIQGLRLLLELFISKKRLLLELATRLSCLRCRSTTSPRISSARKNIRDSSFFFGSAGVPGARLVAFLHAAGPGERSRPSRSTWPRRSEGEPQGGGSSGLRDYEDFDGGGGVDFHGWKKRETKTRLRVVAGSRGPAFSSAGFAGGLASTRKEIAARPHLPQSANLRGG